MSSHVKRICASQSLHKTKETENPKVNPDLSDNQIKDPEEWVSGMSP